MLYENEPQRETVPVADPSFQHSMNTEQILKGALILTALVGTILVGGGIASLAGAGTAILYAH